MYDRSYHCYTILILSISGSISSIISIFIVIILYIHINRVFMCIVRYIIRFHVRTMYMFICIVYV